MWPYKSLSHNCAKNLPEKQVQAKSDLSKQIAETAKKCLGVISRPGPPPPVPLYSAQHW